MARSRNIKASFFINDELSEIDPLGRLLFIGLWTLADYKGDLEWRSRRIKALILPYDECDIDQLLINLDKSGFIRFYSDGEKIYINIIHFTKHQNPHKNEESKGTPIPEYSEEYRKLLNLKDISIYRDKSRLNPEHSATTRDKSRLDQEYSASALSDPHELISDPSNLTPESLDQNFDKSEESKGTLAHNHSEENKKCLNLKDISIYRDKSRLNQEYSASDRADSCFLIPDSCFLIPDSQEVERVPARNRATPTPDIFPVTDQMINWAQAKSITTDVFVETEKFLDYHRAKGSMKKCWSSAWRYWMHNSVKFARTSSHADLDYSNTNWIHDLESEL